MGIASDLDKIESGQDIAERENRVIRAKINTKKAEIDAIGILGPFVLIGLGIIISFFFWGIIGIVIGVILIIAGWMWRTHRENKITKLKNEIKELEAQFI